MINKKMMKKIAEEFLTFSVVWSILSYVESYWLNFLSRISLFHWPSYGPSEDIVLAGDFAAAFISGLAGFGLVSIGMGSKRAVVIAIGIFMLISIARQVKIFGIHNLLSWYFLLVIFAFSIGTGAAFIVVHFLWKAVRSPR